MPVAPAADLVQALRGVSPTYRRSEVQAVAGADRAEVVPLLVAILEDASRDPETYAAGRGDDFAALYALVLVGHLRAAEAHDSVANLCRLPEQVFELVFGGFITEGTDRALLRTSGGRTDRLVELVQDPNVNEYIRAQRPTLSPWRSVVATPSGARSCRSWPE